MNQRTLLQRLNAQYELLPLFVLHIETKSCCNLAFSAANGKFPANFVSTFWSSFIVSKGLVGCKPYKRNYSCSVNALIALSCLQLHITATLKPHEVLCATTAYLLWPGGMQQLISLPPFRLWCWCSTFSCCLLCAATTGVSSKRL